MLDGRWHAQRDRQGSNRCPLCKRRLSSAKQMLASFYGKEPGHQFTIRVEPDGVIVTSGESFRHESASQPKHHTNRSENRKSTRLNSSHVSESRMPSSA